MAPRPRRPAARRRLVRRVLALEDAIDIAGRLPAWIGCTRPIGDKPAGLDEHAVKINRRQSVTGGERDDQLAMNDRQWARCHDQAAIRRAGKCSDGTLDFTGVAHVDRVRLHPERGPPIGFKAERRILFVEGKNGSRRNVAGFRSQENLIQINRSSAARYRTA